jgi:hypothetical protein
MHEKFFNHLAAFCSVVIIVAKTRMFRPWIRRGDDPSLVHQLAKLRSADRATFDSLIMEVCDHAIKSCKYGKTQRIIQLLLSQDGWIPDVNAGYGAGHNTFTLLNRAIRFVHDPKDRLETCRVLLEHKARVDDTKRVSPLDLVLEPRKKKQDSELQLIQLLLRQHYSSSSSSGRVSLPLSSDAMRSVFGVRKDYAEIILLMRAKFDPSAFTATSGSCVPLEYMFSGWEGATDACADAVLLLLDHPNIKQVVYYRDERGETYLHRTSSLTVIQRLIVGFGFKPSDANDRGETAISKWRNNLDITAFFVAGNYATMFDYRLMDLGIRKDAALTQRMIAEWPQCVHHRSEIGQTALHEICAFRGVFFSNEEAREFAQSILDAKADVHAEDGGAFGWTPMHLSCANRMANWKFAELAKWLALLRSYGATPRVDRMRRTPLMLLRFCGLVAHVGLACAAQLESDYFGLEPSRYRQSLKTFISENQDVRSVEPLDLSRLVHRVRAFWDAQQPL